ncbi:Carboxylesterase and related proteins [Phaffia rhodozyma]|uniref:Carboxylesterase and related proteins n=1 Tax=Phaffia rhodozyma TaxID=264483 RepID=A0A0F7SI38_PHARH|nr:Carboxylesterase and related proteins [Phaffia rhodozyma]
MTLLSPPKTYLFKEIEGHCSGGCYIDVYLPSVSPSEGGKTPVALLIHGGAFIVGERGEIPDHQINYLLEKGIAVVDVDYRKAPHVGFVEMIADCQSAYDFIRSDLNDLLKKDGYDQGELDKDNIAFGGYSAGSYLAAMLALQTKPKALLLFYGLFDLLQISPAPKEAYMLGCKPEEIAYMNQLRDQEIVIGAPTLMPDTSARKVYLHALLLAGSLIATLLPADLPDDQETRTSFSPAFLATADFPPSFFIVPQIDMLVPCSQSWLFAKRLEELGVEVGTMRVDGAPHAYDRKGGPQNELDGSNWIKGTLPGLEFLVDKLGRK